MIVREREDKFIMIEQDNHAIMSDELMKNWKESLFHGEELRQSVQYAIRYHDYGWKPFDKEPFWNDRSQAPYTFSDYPLSPKMVIYTFGIHEVEKNDPYAALLCSRHYSRFLLQDPSEEAVAFIKQEKHRQKRLIESFAGLNDDLFNFHYGLLKLGDDLSLYMCLNEPGVPKEKEHFFFRNGITLPMKPGDEKQAKMALAWRDQQTISAHPFPFKERITVKIKQKVINKKELLTNGLIKSYEKAPYEEVKLYFVPEK
jgi:Protein of unknown function (DUF3891)